MIGKETLEKLDLLNKKTEIYLGYAIRGFELKPAKDSTFIKQDLDCCRPNSQAYLLTYYACN